MQCEQGWREADSQVAARSRGQFHCPECDQPWDETHRTDANRHARLLHDGQTIENETLQGEPKPTETLGFRWSAVHNLFLDADEIAAVFSLTCGTVRDLEFARYAGNGQGELSMLRRLMNIFQPGDVLLADRLMCSWREMAMLKQRGVDSVTRLSADRKADFRRGKRLEKDDHIVIWPMPQLRPIDPKQMLRFQTFWRFEKFVFESNKQVFAPSASLLSRPYLIQTRFPRMA